MAAVKPTTTVVGSGSSTQYLLTRLSAKSKLRVAEKGEDNRFDGFSYNISLSAEAAPTPKSLVASQAALAPPMVNKWEDTYKASVYADSFPTGVIPIIAAPGTIYPPRLFGGDEELKVPEEINPSYDIIAEISTSLSDPAYNTTLLDKVKSISALRTSVAATTNTYDNTAFGPDPGPSDNTALSSGTAKAISRLQSASAGFAPKFAKKFSARVDLITATLGSTPILPDSSTSGARTQNVSVTPQGALSPVSETPPSGYTSGGTSAPSNALFASIGREHKVNQIRTKQSQLRANNGILDNPETIASSFGGTVNTGDVGALSSAYDIVCSMNKHIKRIVFQTVAGKPPGHSYWMPTYTASQIKNTDFVTPLKIIGYETGATLATRVFFPTNDLIINTNPFDTVALLWQSGIGPKADLTALGIPCLLDLPVGQKVVTRVGFKMKITANNALVGGAVTGSFGPLIFADGADAVAGKPKRRARIEVKKEAAANTYTAKVILQRPRSYGRVKGTSQWPSSTTPAVAYNPKFFSPHNPLDTDFVSAIEDTNDMARAVQLVAGTFFDLDAAVTFQNPALSYAAIQASTPTTLVAALYADPTNFIMTNESFGGASMSKIVPILNPVQVTGVGGIVRGSGKLRIMGSAVTPLVSDKVNALAAYIPAADGDPTASSLVHAEYIAQKMFI